MYGYPRSGLRAGAGVVLVAASFVYVFDPRRGQGHLERFLIGIGGVLFLVAAAGELAGAVKPDASWLLPALVVSGAAYVVLAAA